jgi:hypothetical protein
MVQPDLATARVYVQMQGAPALDGSGCSSRYFVGQMSDPNFKSFVFPSLLAANATGTTIHLVVSGCDGLYPIIVSVEYGLRVP